MTWNRVYRCRPLGVAGLFAGALWLAVSAAPTQAAVYLEDSPAALQLAGEARDLQTQGRLGEAAQKLQEIVDEYPDKLMPFDDTGYTDARRWVRQRLADDPALLEAYRRRFAAAAERERIDAASAAINQREAKTLAVVERYPLTTAGMEAALQLAGRYVESGDAAGADAMLWALASHPDRAAFAGRYDELRAWAAALAGDAAEMEAALTDLSQHADPSALASLSETLRAIVRPVELGPAEQKITAEPPLSRPLWQVSIETTLENKLVIGQTRVAQNAAGETAELYPVASGAMLLVNDNQSVYALDRVSGRLRWAYRYELPEDDRAPNTLGFGTTRVIQDRREVLVRGDGAFAVLGFAVPWQGRQRQQNIEPTQLVGLDRDTGGLRWAVTPGQLDPALERAAFHGTPVSSGDQIIVMARRSQASSFQDSYLFSVDAATGDLRWRRHLASTAGPNSRNALSPMSSMTLDGSTVYLCDNLGATAAVDARTGSVRWVRVLLDDRVDERGRPQNLVIPFSDVARPQRCAAGLIVPMRVNEARGLLLDPDTGEVLESFTSRSPVADAYDLQTLDDGDVLIIGPKLARLAGDTLEPRWTTAILPNNIEGVTPRVSLRPGVAMVAREATGLQEIDLTTGELLTEHQLAWTGSVLATGDAWIVTSGRKLGGYLDWSVAYATLRERAEAQPRSPEPGLNMAMLAINAGQPEAADEGVDRALSALAADAPLRDRDPEAWRAERARVFEELLALTERPDAMEPAVIERLLDRLAVTTETPAELLAYNLARGDFLVSHDRLAEAVEFYQAILLDTQQADEVLVRGDSSRRGDIAARLRLLRLAESGRSDFYERFDRQAQRELAALRADPRADVDALLGLARRYPLARVAAEAILSAADLQAQSSAHSGAATQYRRAFQLTQDDELRRRAAGSLAGYYQSVGRPDAAIRWLEQVVRDRPDLMPWRDGLPVDPQAWLAELRALPESASAGIGRMPEVVPPFTATIRIRGQVVPAVEAEAVPDRPGGVLFVPHDGQQQLAFYDLSTHDRRWTVNDMPAGLRLVDQGRDNLVLWQPQEGELRGLDASRGETLWDAIQVAPLLDDLGEGGLDEARQANAGGLLSIIEADFGPINRGQFNNQAEAAGDVPAAPPRVLAGEAVACVVDDKGRAFGLDRTNGQVLWQSALPVDAVTHALVVDEVLAVAGKVSPDTEAESGRFLLVDLATGRLRFPPIEDHDPAIQLLFTPDGDPMVLTRTQLLRYDRRDGGLRWRLSLDEFNGLPQTIPAGDTLFIHDRVRLLSIDLSTGDIQNQLPNLLSRSNTVGMNLGRDRTIYSLTPEGSVAFDADLSIRWQDALASQPKQLVTQALGERHVFVFEQYAGAFGPPGLRLSALDRTTGRLLAQRMLMDLGQAGAMTTVQVLPGHLLVAGRSEFAMIPGTPTPREGSAANGALFSR